jgi:hypothetical protein
VDEFHSFKVVFSHRLYYNTNKVFRSYFFNTEDAYY